MDREKFCRKQWGWTLTGHSPAAWCQKPNGEVIHECSISKSVGKRLWRISVMPSTYVLQGEENTKLITHFDANALAGVCRGGPHRRDGAELRTPAGALHRSAFFFLNSRNTRLPFPIRKAAFFRSFQTIHYNIFINAFSKFQHPICSDFHLP